MADDFDDELYNVYNGVKDDGHGNTDIYDGYYKDIAESQPEHNNVNPDTSGNDQASDSGQDYAAPTQHDDYKTPGMDELHNEPQSQMQQHLGFMASPQAQAMMSNWGGFQGNPFQFAAYQRMQQMVNPYQMQQMMQMQFRQQQQSISNRDDDVGGGNRRPPPVASPANQDEGKMFIGGLNWETTDESLKQYFSQFGEVKDCVVMRDPMTGRSRGFGFLTMADESAIDTIVNQDHYLDGKRIDPKRAIPREEQDKTEKIFVGGIPPDVDEEEFFEFFSQFGKVIDATLMTNRDTGRPRGFGFITFGSSAGVEEALRQPCIEIKGKQVEVKRAMPKTRQARPNTFGTNFGGGSGRGGYMPNTRYASGPSYGGPMQGGRGYNMMYGNMYGGGYGNYNMAAAYYGRGGGASGGYYGRGGNSYNGGDNSGDYHDDDHQGGDYDHKEHEHSRGDDRRYSRDSRDRGGEHGSSRGYGGSSSSGGGGAVHASQNARNQHHYRPY